MIRRALATIAVAALLVAMATPLMAQPQEGQMAPDFTLKDYAGKSYKLSDFRGKVVLLDAWATW